MPPSIKSRGEASTDYTQLKKGVPLQEFAPATKWIPWRIPVENLYGNSSGCRSKLLQRPWPFYSYDILL